MQIFSFSFCVTMGIVSTEVCSDVSRIWLSPLKKSAENADWWRFNLAMTLSFFERVMIWSRQDNYNLQLKLSWLRSIWRMNSWNKRDNLVLVMTWNRYDSIEVSKWNLPLYVTFIQFFVLSQLEKKKKKPFKHSSFEPSTPDCLH